MTAKQTRTYSRILALLMLASFLAAPVVFAHDDPVEHEIHELLDAFLAGASTNDVDMHDRFWAEDLVYTGSNGQRRDKFETMAGVAAATPTDVENLPVYRGEDVNIRVFDDVAVVTFRLVAEMADETTGEYFNTGVFQRRHGQWKAFTWQATRIPETNGE